MVTGRVLPSKYSVHTNVDSALRQGTNTKQCTSLEIESKTKRI
jgi:putative NIF3 family GTP cyclohydrolase 1 type 2